jgi:hypothetical protein
MDEIINQTISIQIGLPLFCLLISYVGYCMFSFDLPDNYVEDPEVLIRRAKAQKSNEVQALTS